MNSFVFYDKVCCSEQDLNLAMSGGIQKLIGPVKSRLEQCIEDAENLLKVRVMADSDFDGEESDVKYFIKTFDEQPAPETV